MDKQAEEHGAGVEACEYVESYDELIADTTLENDPVPGETVDESLARGRYFALQQALDVCSTSWDCVGVVRDWGSPPFRPVKYRDDGTSGYFETKGVVSYRKTPLDCFNQEDLPPFPLDENYWTEGYKLGADAVAKAFEKVQLFYFTLRPECKSSDRKRTYSSPE